MTAPALSDAERVTAPDLTAGTFLSAGWYLTTAEAAGELDIDYRSVWKAITLGHITARRVGRRHLIPAAEVVRYRDRRAAAVPVRPPRRKQGHRGGSGVQSYPSGAPAAPSMVVYHHIDGSTHYITRHRALALLALHSYNGITPEGALVNRLFVRELDGLSRARIIHHLDALHQRALIMRGESRDRKGGPVATVWLTLRGADTLRYCQERGLV
jgi:excisionase family DNA binding protein